jgi:hypothetical protein
MSIAQARGSSTPSHQRCARRDHVRGGALPPATTAAASMGSGELRPWHRRRRDWSYGGRSAGSWWTPARRKSSLHELARQSRWLEIRCHRCGGMRDEALQRWRGRGR